MELKLNKDTICMQEELLRSNFEQAIDCEFTLPDYCPDIVRILKCSINTKIISSRIANKSINIDGCANIEIQYIGEENKLRGYELPVSFSKSIDINDDINSADIKIKTKCEYVNFRAVNNRKIDVHGAVSIFVVASFCANKEILMDAQGCGVQKKSKTLNYKDPIGIIDKQFLINEDTEIPENNSIAHIIRHDEKLIFDETKPITNKVIVKGRVKLNVFYCTEKDEYEHITKEIPFNQIMDMFGADEECKVSILGDICCCELKTLTAPDGVCKIINSVIKMNISVFCYKNNSVTTITDAYSTKYNLSSKEQVYSNICEKESLSDSFSFSEKVTLPDDTVKIIDIWNTVPDFSYELNENGLDINILTSLCIVSKTTEGNIGFSENKINANKHFDIFDCDEMNLQDIRIKNITYTLTDSGCADVKMEFVILGNLCCNENFSAISDIEIIDEKMIANQAPLTVYFADKGENLWDIAIKYNTETEAIMRANELQDHLLEKSMPLLIPSVI